MKKGFKLYYSENSIREVENLVNLFNNRGILGQMKYLSSENRNMILLEDLKLEETEEKWFITLDGNVPGEIKVMDGNLGLWYRTTVEDFASKEVVGQGGVGIH